jgi:hypothetical protein
VLEITLAQKVSVEHAAMSCMLWAVRLSFADLGFSFSKQYMVLLCNELIINAHSSLQLWKYLNP